MKKFVSWIVCAILMLTAWIIPSNSSSSIAGTGIGMNERVETVEEMGAVLRSFSQNETLKNAAYAFASSTTPNETENTESKYKSVTCATKTTASVSAKYFDSNYYSSSSVLAQSSYTMNRSMTLCMTENETYYDVSAQIYSSSESNRDSRSFMSMGITMDFELYVNRKDNLSYIKMSRFDTNYTSSEEKENETVKEVDEQKGRMLNKWISTTGIESAFTDVNEKNYRQLSIVGNAILLAETGDFTQSGSSFSMNDAPAKQLCADLLAVLSSSIATKDDFDDASFTVNLSSKDRPSFELLYSMSESNPKIDAGERLTCRLSNINNTVIRFPKNVKIYTFADFE